MDSTISANAIVPNPIKWRNLVDMVFMALCFNVLTKESHNRAKPIHDK